MEEVHVHVEDVEKGPNSWLTNACAHDAPITTVTLEKKARQFAAGPCLVMSAEGTTWVKYKRAHGQKNDADVRSAKTWVSTVLSDLLLNFEPQNRHNAIVV